VAFIVHGLLLAGRYRTDVAIVPRL
jgi:hypothetical protein